ncbi:MAG: hypothetical protein JXR34_04985 [Bacteroidales bacterium]|nr:hypothetical protein [Bacteroidales bacterium]
MNKVFSFLIVALLSLSVVFVSCKKDDETDDTTTPVVTNKMVYNGTTYALSNAYVFYYGKENEVPASYNLDLVLSSSGFVYNQDSMDFVGTGDAIYFELFSSDSTKFSNGTYMMDTMNFGFPMTFDYAEVLLGYNLATDAGIYEEIVSGSFVVATSGSNYVFTFTGKTDSGEDVTISYTGGITKTIDESKSKGKNNWMEL